jgi:hypothetical protein
VKKMDGGEEGVGIRLFPCDWGQSRGSADGNLSHSSPECYEVMSDAVILLIHAKEQNCIH